MTLESIMNRRVRAADGKMIGHVFDFTAKKIENDVRITHLHVGASAWIDRLGLGDLLHRRLGWSVGHEIPWEAIESIDKNGVRLREGWDAARCRLHPIRDQEEDREAG